MEVYSYTAYGGLNKATTSKYQGWSCFATDREKPEEPLNIGKPFVPKDKKLL